MDTYNNKVKVWVVLSTDTSDGDEWWQGWASLFARREDAVKCLRDNAEVDADAYNTEIEWRDDEHESFAVIDTGGGEIVHRLKEEAVN